MNICTLTLNFKIIYYIYLALKNLVPLGQDSLLSGCSLKLQGLDKCQHFFYGPFHPDKNRGDATAEKRFKAYGVAALLMGMFFVLVLFVSIIANGYTGHLFSAGSRAGGIQSMNRRPLPTDCRSTSAPEMSKTRRIASGPAGWNSAILQLLEGYGHGKTT